MVRSAVAVTVAGVERRGRRAVRKRDIPVERVECVDFLADIVKEYSRGGEEIPLAPR